MTGDDCLTGGTSDSTFAGGAAFGLAGVQQILVTAKRSGAAIETFIVPLSSNPTVELTRRRESKHASPHQVSCETRSRRSRPTICSMAHLENTLAHNFERFVSCAPEMIPQSYSVIRHASYIRSIAPYDCPNMFSLAGSYVA